MSSAWRILLALIYVFTWVSRLSSVGSLKSSLVLPLSVKRLTCSKRKTSIKWWNRLYMPQHIWTIHCFLLRLLLDPSHKYLLIHFQGMRRIHIICCENASLLTTFRIIRGVHSVLVDHVTEMGKDCWRKYFSILPSGREALCTGWLFFSLCCWVFGFGGIIDL